ncbi:MAG: tRNA (adenosine(37)-N6)-threonylcarbamoyltransferase complex dimerization subunit type 1 TsaB [Bacteroidota bacterium]
MIVLGIETATAVCGTALVRDGVVLAEAALEMPRIHAERLMPLADEACRKAGIGPRELDGVAVSIGPGSFTGLRIGLSAAKGLAFATGAALVAVPTLQALVRRVRADEGTLILAVLDAGREDVYAQFFLRTPEGDAETTPARALPVEEVLREAGELLKTAGDRPAVVTGDGREKIRRSAAGIPLRFAADDESRCGADAVALLGEEMLRGGRVADPAGLEPHYIRDFLFTRAHTCPGSSVPRKR